MGRPLGKHLTPEERAKILAAVEEIGNYSHVAEMLGVDRNTVRKIVRDKRSDGPKVTYPPLVDDDLPIEKLVDIMAQRATKRMEAAASREWQTISIRGSEPTVIAFVGDPHLDDDGTDWAQLKADIELLKSPHVYAVNIGDTTNSWGGRLIRLYANQETSKRTARKLAKWFLAEAGIPWLVWLSGNHEDMDGSFELFRLMNTKQIVMEEWQAKFRVEWQNGFSVPIWAAHDFKYKSQYNILHGVQRAARERRGASIYVAGHHHTWSIAQEEQADTGEIFWSMRARGYKMLDQHAIRWGFDSKRYGCTVAAVINPKEQDPHTSIHCFADLATAIRFRNSL